MTLLGAFHEYANAPKTETCMTKLDVFALCMGMELGLSV